MKLLDCIQCEFLKQVQEEQGRSFKLTPGHAKGTSRRKA
jgi:hypothetical protein